MSSVAQLDIRPNQRWRLANGDEVSVDVVEKDQISGAVKKPGYPGGAVAAYVGHRNDFQQATLIAPVWRASIVAPVKGQGVADETLQRLGAIGTVEARSTPRIESATESADATIRGDLAEYVVDLPAVDAENAQEIIEGALRDIKPQNVRVSPI